MSLKSWSIVAALTANGSNRPCSAWSEFEMNPFPPLRILEEQREKKEAYEYKQG
jgi:hypothetical protein